MKTDYTYCLSRTCIHRRGCRRALCNYTDKEINDFVAKCGTNMSFLMPEECMLDDEDEGKMGFDMLDRFRLSDGTEMKK